MESKFTPGPWQVVNSTDVFTSLGGKNAQGVAADNDDGWQVADTHVGITFVDGEDSYLSMDECIANAHLMAVAPDMYAFIKDLLANYELGEKLDAEMTSLLAKARGESVTEASPVSIDQIKSELTTGTVSLENYLRHNFDIYRKVKP